MRIREKSREGKVKPKPPGGAPKAATRPYMSNAARGLGPQGGGWNIAQAARWSGLSEPYLRDLIKRKEAGEDVDCFPFYRAGRRLLVPRRGFQNWFDKLNQGSAA